VATQSGEHLGTCQVEQTRQPRERDGIDAFVEVEGNRRGRPPRIRGVRRLIAFSGIPGTGKSVLAEMAARELGIALVSKDIVEATLWRNGVGREQRSGWIAYELLTALAEAQLMASGAVIIDSVAPKESVRGQWRDMAERSGAVFQVIECVCSDAALHRQRLSVRERGIPGWYELTWDEIERVGASYEPWTDQRLVLDAVQPLEDNARTMLRFLDAPSMSKQAAESR
jgi:predicted kinase